VGFFIPMNKEILRLALPNILTNLSIPLVSLVDLALMGHMPTTSYIVAIGFGTVIFNFIYWAFGFLRMSSTGLVAQAFGKNDLKAIRILLFRALFIAVFGALLLIFLQAPIIKFALLIIQPDEAVVEPLLEYFNIRIWAAIATISIYVLTGWLLGMQDSKSALALSLVVNGVNALLSYSLVTYFGWGIKGVAWGTVIAQYVGFVVALLIIRYKYQIVLLKQSFIWVKDRKAWGNFLGINSDIFIRTLCLIFAMSFFKTKAGNIDPILGAANILLLEFITISAYGIDGFAFAAESISGKYFGIGMRSEFKKSINLTFRWGFGIATFLSLIFAFYGESLLYILTDKLEVVQKALIYLPWLIAAPIVNSFAFIWDGIYVGTTASKTMRNTMLFATLFVFLPTFYLSIYFWGNHGIWFAFSLFMFSRGVLLHFFAKQSIYSRI